MAVFATLTLAQAGDPILAAADGYREAAVVGDNLLALASNVGMLPFVADGRAPDRKDIAVLGLPDFGHRIDIERVDGRWRRCCGPADPPGRSCLRNQGPEDPR